MRFRVYLYAFLSQLVCVSLSAFFYQTVGIIFKWPLQLFIIWLTPAVIYVMIRKKLFTEEQKRLTNTIKYMTSAFFKSWLFNVTEHIAYFAQFFGIVSALALFFDIASLILTSVGLAKKKGRYLTYLIFTIIMTIINAILVLVYISGGFQIVVTS